MGQHYCRVRKRAVRVLARGEQLIERHALAARKRAWLLVEGSGSGRQAQANGPGGLSFHSSAVKESSLYFDVALSPLFYQLAAERDGIREHHCEDRVSCQ